MSANDKFKYWETGGVVWTVLLGVPLHFLYSATGWEAIAWLAPVNESTWEHFKLAFWPMLVWALVEWMCCPGQRKGLWTGKLIALIATPSVITAIFYGYTALIGRNILSLDIATFVVSVVVGYLLSYWYSTGNIRLPFAPVGVTLLALLFVAFTYYPPRILSFR